MEKQFEIIRKTRGFLVSIIDELTLEKINRVPEGFSNNIAWNLGHVIAAQQGVCYKRIGIQMRIEEELFQQYKPESKPEGAIGEEELLKLKELLFSTIDQLEEDYRQNKLANYIPWKTRYGVAINSIEDAINFLTFH